MRPIRELHVARPLQMERVLAAVLASLARDEFARRAQSEEEEGCFAVFYDQACGCQLKHAVPKTLWLVCPGGGAVPQHPLDRLASPITDRQLDGPNTWMNSMFRGQDHLSES